MYENIEDPKHLYVYFDCSVLDKYAINGTQKIIFMEIHFEGKVSY